MRTMKFFYRKYGALIETVEAWKVYDVMPEEVPEGFRKSKLICFDSVKLEHTMSGYAKIEAYKHSMTDREGIEKYLLGCIEISEEKFNELYNKCVKLKNDIKQAIEDEDSM